ncbi:DNA topoisomerase IB [Rhodospirillaceae bacterium SYSU D60014]|uniref:DNA topoisomerase IB n=1 Tax=Virgifigura deserti TaxID=2268457 RepID=UPI000E675D70
MSANSPTESRSNSRSTVCSASSDIIVDPVAASRQAGLRYVNDETPGITRRRAGKGFSYRDPEGRPVKDPETLRRIRALAIPPAYTDVWICPDPRGHIQATGRDDRGRKQYRYHPRWRAMRDGAKFDHMHAFAAALPRIRAQVETDMARPGLPREKVLATIVKLLEITLIRVGNEEYARNNHSFGLTTLRDQHVRIDEATMNFEFRAKSGRMQKIRLRDRRLARIIKSCRDIPGKELFQYLDDDGQRQVIDSGDVNDYLRAASGAEITAKDFRTWAGTVLAAYALQEFESFDSAAAGRRNVTRAIERVAAELGNTPTVCRKSYVHPAVVDAYLDGSLLSMLKERVEQDLRDDLSGLSGEEAAVLAFLQQRLARATDQPGKTSR